MLVGDFGVGKSSLVEQFVHNRFSEEYKSTIGVVINKKEFLVDGVSIKFLIWDVAGSREIAEVPASYYLGCSGLFFVFDLSRQETWSNMPARIEIVKQKSKCDNVVVIGNKSDLYDEAGLQDVLGNVGVAVDFVTSAKNNNNVEQAFVELARTILDG